jgi:hypothetical protein
MIIILFCLFIWVFIFGFYLNKVIYYFLEKIKIKSLNEQFRLILNKIKSGETKFKYRANDTVYISINNLKEWGEVELVYMIKDKKISIFKDGGVMSTSKGVDKSIIDDIISKIHSKYHSDIMDVLNIYGMIISRKRFEKLVDESIFFNLNNKESYNGTHSSNNEFTKNIDLEIDDILDKISDKGLDSLTKFEKEFLEKYSKNGTN